MSHSLFRFALGLVLLAGCSMARGQGSPDRAYPMNVEDRINEVSSADDDVITVDDDRPLTAAGAYPMNTTDRINSGWRERVNTTDRIKSPKSSSGTLPKDARTAGGAVVNPSLKDRPDAWRYRWHENRWWYYGANSQWLYWTGNHWNSFAATSAVEKDAGNRTH